MFIDGYEDTKRVDIRPLFATQLRHVICAKRLHKNIYTRMSRMRRASAFALTLGRWRNVEQRSDYHRRALLSSLDDVRSSSKSKSEDDDAKNTVTLHFWRKKNDDRGRRRRQMVTSAITARRDGFLPPSLVVVRSSSSSGGAFQRRRLGTHQHSDSMLLDHPSSQLNMEIPATGGGSGSGGFNNNGNAFSSTCSPLSSDFFAIFSLMISFKSW